MKLRTKITVCRVASYAALAAAVAALAADLSVFYGMVFVAGWDWQDPAHTGLPYFWPVLLFSALSFGLFKAYNALIFKAQRLEHKAEFQAAQRRAERRRGA